MNEDSRSFFTTGWSMISELNNPVQKMTHNVHDAPNAFLLLSIVIGQFCSGAFMTA